MNDNVVIEENRGTLSERNRRAAQAPRNPRGYKRLYNGRTPTGLPQWMLDFDREIARMKKHPVINRAYHVLQNELKTMNITTSEEQVQMCARAKALLDMTDGALFSIMGGPVNRNKRKLHAMVVERKDLVTQYMSLRYQLGLDSDLRIRASMNGLLE